MPHTFDNTFDMSFWSCPLIPECESSVMSYNMTDDIINISITSLTNKKSYIYISIESSNQAEFNRVIFKLIEDTCGKPWSYSL